MEDKDLEIEIDQYLGEAKSFEETTPKEADELLEAKEGNIVYIGRETCPYCRRFVKTLGPLAKEHHLKIHYVHAQHPEYEQEVNELREKYDVPTVPGLLYSSETAGMVVKCDSSLDAEEILEIVEATE
ncbi:bacteriocin transport accessory protein, putative [Atopostipes suicloacalis DSM 15692]|uniref:Bacteriocin transport accessory protein, putative n=1 Tax=Atopostipes suicloacalis DSM 15692 TaxID=1121025 RepID=A0A1M4SF53_9LACT|nr:glutaredoxin domain-containing protein [Atopostipes suicloacalis]SHE30894.1 bacteriocin transport accessory protein, putative [Atopostipes suicloacalis DSM 15692]